MADERPRERAGEEAGDRHLEPDLCSPWDILLTSERAAAAVSGDLAAPLPQSTGEDREKGGGDPVVVVGDA